MKGGELDFDLSGLPNVEGLGGGAGEVGRGKVLTVTELTGQIRRLLEEGIGFVWVQGEVSNFKRSTAKHCYFTLKDQGAQLACVIFWSIARYLDMSRVADGREVELFGKLSVYQERGQYQLIVEECRAKGAGALFAKFEALKKKLDAEGLFRQERKRPLPKFPARVGVVTSPKGAALRDFLKVLHRRHPGIEVVINPVSVQGAGASVGIARAILEFSCWEGMPAVDVVVVTRGGGSFEDLWEFNEEVVVRAIAASRVPVVSAVGHEVDFTLSDFVADFRAPTPSVAAEVLSAEAKELADRLDRDFRRMGTYCRSRLMEVHRRLSGVGVRDLAREPIRAVRDLSLHLDRLVGEMESLLTGRTEAIAQRVQRAVLKLNQRPTLQLIQYMKRNAGERLWRLRQLTENTLKRAGARLEAAAGKLVTLNPDAVLSRGYAMVLDEQRLPVTSARKLKVGNSVVIRFYDGQAGATVHSVE